MKNSFKIAALALVIATSFAACKGSSEATTDSVKVDSISVDSIKSDSVSADTTVAPSDTVTKK